MQASHVMTGQMILLANMHEQDNALGEELQPEVDELIEAQERGDKFLVLRKETDGYWDIISLKTYKIYNAWSAYHFTLYR